MQDVVKRRENGNVLRQPALNCLQLTAPSGGPDSRAGHTHSMELLHGRMYSLSVQRSVTALSYRRSSFIVFACLLPFRRPNVLSVRPSPPSIYVDPLGHGGMFASKFCAKDTDDLVAQSGSRNGDLKLLKDVLFFLRQRSRSLRSGMRNNLRQGFYSSLQTKLRNV